MHADGKPVTVDLISVLQPRLHDTLAATDLIEESMHVGNEIVVHVGKMSSDHGAEQQPAEPGSRIDRQDEVAERDASRRRDGTRMPDFQFGQQHRNLRYT
jgi:hypothetical protein